MKKASQGKSARSTTIHLARHVTPNGEYWTARVVRGSLKKGQCVFECSHTTRTGALSGAKQYTARVAATAGPITIKG